MDKYHQTLIEKGQKRKHSFVELVNDKGVSLFLVSTGSTEKVIEDLCDNEALIRYPIIKLGIVEFNNDDSYAVYSRIKNSRICGSIVNKDSHVEKIENINNPIIDFLDELASKKSIKH